MSDAFFPVLGGQGWSVYKRPGFQTLVSQHVSGREVRAALMAYPLYEYELSFPDYLPDGDLGGDLRTLMGFFLARRGQFDSFLFVDPTDCQVAGQALGQGDGNATSFPLIRGLGGFVEPVAWATQVSAVRVGGVPLPSGWNLQAPATLTFATPPASGQAVTADFTYAFRCRFLEDQQDFENFAAQLWSLKSCKFRSVKE